MNVFLRGEKDDFSVYFYFREQQYRIFKGDKLLRIVYCWREAAPYLT